MRIPRFSGFYAINPQSTNVDAGVYFYNKLDNLEREIDHLKIDFVSSLHRKQKKAATLGGLLKGVKFSEEEILTAKKRLFKNV